MSRFFKSAAFPILIVLVLALAALVTAAVAPARAHPPAQYTQVRILAEWPGEVERKDFEALLLPFLQDFDVQPVLVSATNLEETLRQQIDAGTPPDLVIMTQPGLLADYARTAQVIDLGAALGDALAFPQDGTSADEAERILAAYSKIKKQTACVHNDRHPDWRGGRAISWDPANDAFLFLPEYPLCR